MTNAVLYSYLIGWAVTSVGMALTTRRRPRSTTVVVVAGVAWPFLLLGAAQFAAVALVAELARNRGPDPRSIDDELEELLTEWATSRVAAHSHRLSVSTSSDEFRARLSAAGIPHEAHEEPGGHIFRPNMFVLDLDGTIAWLHPAI